MTDATADAAPIKGARRGRKKLMLLGIPVVIVLAAVGLCLAGVLPNPLSARHAPAAEAAEPAPTPPVFIDLPEIVANLNGGGRRPSFVKLRAKIEISRDADRATVEAAMPRLLDLLQTYLRETRPDELQGSVGVWRLRQELIARANLAAAPAHVTDVLFTDMLVQ